MFTKRNLEQIQDQGFTPEKIDQQINNFIKGFPKIHLTAPATPQNGLVVLSEEDENRYISIFENALASGLDTLKFVPASGAASRMFKDLFEYIDNDSNEESPFMQYFFENIEKFAFYDQLKALVPDLSKKQIVSNILSDNGLGYGNKPKGQIAFHKYNSTFRTPFEEHLVEAASYCTGSDGISKVHFTVSPEHIDGFKELLEKVKPNFQKRYGLKLEASFSFQHKSTDTIAVDLNNRPILTETGDLIFRPGGHGALIENLSELNADIIFIKNIDNVVPDRLKPETKKYKKALAGLLVTLRNKVYTYLDKLEKPDGIKDEELLNKIGLFLKKDLKINFENTFESKEQQIAFFIQKLNRPIRICGMVKNEGEPGGGPYWVLNEDETSSLQIIEKAQIDFSDAEQVEHFNNSSHFNPVDLICSTKNYKGESFDLNQFIDHQTGFISTKSKDGIELKALELPGLWNGAMSNWNSIFVEVPVATFNPVKTINDLLRSEHQQ